MGPIILRDQSLKCILWTLGSLPEPHFSTLDWDFSFSHGNLTNSVSRSVSKSSSRSRSRSGSKSKCPVTRKSKSVSRSRSISKSRSMSRSVSRSVSKSRSRSVSKSSVRSKSRSLSSSRSRSRSVERSSPVKEISKQDSRVQNFDVKLPNFKYRDKDVLHPKTDNLYPVFSLSKLQLSHPTFCHGLNISKAPKSSNSSSDSEEETKSKPR